MITVNPMIPVFIASPRDVSRERRLAESAVHALAPRMAHLFGVTLVPLLWEEFAPISSYDESHPQVGILKRIQSFSIFVGILWNRCGTSIGQSKETGTESEFQHAIRHRKTIAVLSYFRKQSSVARTSSVARSQQKAVNDLKARLQDSNVMTTDYNGVSHFAKRILPDIMEACLQLIVTHEPKKVSDLYKFFKRGSHWRFGTRQLYIAYPPITDPGPGHPKPRIDWRHRLLPHVIYEDFKAIQDIEEAMRLLGREYKTVSTDSPNLDMADPGDRVWVCVPRNAKAHRVLEKLEEDGRRIRFHFHSRNNNGRPETCLKWLTGTREIEIRSPLAKYLRQSARPRGASEWRPAFGHTYCRDYAVLARFKIMSDPQDRSSEDFYHYFVGGIRGLGTWGVGYLLDHESSMLVRMAENQTIPTDSDDVQLLLEVTYENFRITRVRDISEESESFFKRRLSDSYIRDQLLRHPDWLPR